MHGVSVNFTINVIEFVLFGSAVMTYIYRYLSVIANALPLKINILWVLYPYTKLLLLFFVGLKGT